MHVHVKPKTVLGYKICVFEMTKASRNFSYIIFAYMQSCSTISYFPLFSHIFPLNFHIFKTCYRDNDLLFVSFSQRLPAKKNPPFRALSISPSTLTPPTSRRATLMATPPTEPAVQAGLESMEGLALDTIIAKAGARPAAALACASTHLRAAVADDALWRRFCVQDFGLDAPLDPEDRPLPSFKVCCRLDPLSFLSAN